MLSRWLSQWNYAELEGARSRDATEERFYNALGAEDAVRDALVAAGHPRSAIQLRRRVFVPSQGRRREVDVIVVTNERVFVVEVKHWAGHVWCTQDEWFQRPPMKRAAPKNHGEVMAEALIKTEAIAQYLRSNGIRLPAGSVTPVLVFTHPGCTIEVSTTRAVPHAMTLATFLKVVGTRPAWQNWAARVVPWALPPVPVLPEVYARVANVIHALPSWDVLTLHRGAIMTGDILGFTVPDAASANSKISPQIDGRDVAEAEIWWPRGLWGMMRALVFGSRAACRLVLREGAQLPVCLGGVRDNTVRGKFDRAVEARKAHRHNPRRFNPRDEPPTRTDAPRMLVEIPISDATTTSQQRPASIRFRAAGQMEAAFVPLRDIARVDLGRQADD